MTARWVVEVVQPERDLQITWQPISLLLKNDPPPDSEWYPPSAHTHNLLRVMESVKDAHGNEGAFQFYWEAGRRIHHDQQRDVPADEILEAAGLDASHAAAYDDETIDSVIRAKMNDGLALVGEDVGTPIIAFDSDAGRTGLFGPVITRAPKGEQGLAFWDAIVTMATTDGFWELKRTRTEPPDFGDRP